MLLIILQILLASLLAGCVRFHWDQQHRLQLITNTGAIRDVQEMLDHEFGCMVWYAGTLEDEADRNLAVAVTKAHQAGENAVAEAAEILPPPFDVCEQHFEYFHDTDVDEDGIYTSEFAQCEQCWQLYEMDDADDDREPDTAIHDFVKKLFSSTEEGA